MIFYFIFGIVYLVLLAFGILPTWRFAVNTILAGSSEIGFAIVLFILAILIIGPFMGIITIGKFAVLKIGRKTTL